jgi:type II secretory pathway pseudopilin PulG
MRQYFQRLKPYQNEKGIALVVVLLVLAVVSIMGVTVLGLSINSLKESSTESNYQSTYYIAESGATYELNNLSSSILQEYNSSNDGLTFFNKVEANFKTITYTDFESNGGQQPSTVITVTKKNDDNANSATTRDYTITSIGTIGNSSRTVTQTFHLNWIPKNDVNIPSDTSVFVKTLISLDRGATISGAIGTNSSLPNQILLNGGSRLIGNNNIYVGPTGGSNVVNKAVTNPIIPISAVKGFVLPPFPEIPTYPTLPDQKTTDSKGKKIYYLINNGALQVVDYVWNNYTLDMTNQDLSFSSLEIDDNYQLNIDVGNSNRNLVVKDLNIPNGNIKILGTGTLTIYVTGNITMGSGSIINMGQNVNQLNIYLTGSGSVSSPKTLTLTGSQKIYGSLYAEDANIDFGNGSGFQGNILTGGKSVTVDGGAYANTQLFYAPNADFSLLGGGTIQGSIIANSLTATGGSKIIYEKLDQSSLPFFLSSGTSGTATISDLMTTDPVQESD